MDHVECGVTIVRSGVLPAVAVKIAVFCVVVLCGLVDEY
jgi:hypothetical protein